MDDEKDLLLHICCAPCVAYPHEKLVDLKIEFVGFWYNPNIHPYSEYNRRLHALQRYTALRPLKVIFQDVYDVKIFIKGALEEEEKGNPRCQYCYRERLLTTARKAREEGFRRFSTTMLCSGHQDHTLMKRLGKEAADETGVEFYYHDFRPGKKRGYGISKELDLYRQKYCGCIFSEEERYRPPPPGPGSRSR